MKLITKYLANRTELTKLIYGNGMKSLNAIFFFVGHHSFNNYFCLRYMKNRNIFQEICSLNIVEHVNIF